MDTWLKEFRLKPNGGLEKPDDLIELIEKLLKDLANECTLVYKRLNEKKIVALFTDHNGINILLKKKEDGLLTLDISNWKTDDSNFKQKVQELDDKFRQTRFVQKPETSEYPSLPAIKRGREFSHYENIGGLIVERDFDRVVFDEVTPFQHIRILHSIQFGNCLYVDNGLNIAESDYDEYSRAMSGFGMADYAGKTVLILGGGDGCVLRHIKDQGPTMVTAVDIDQRIIDVTKLYQRRLCKNILDSLTGENYEIIIDDAKAYLEKCTKEGRKFDYVINEITAVPPINDEARWNFLHTLLNLSMMVLKDGGMYFTHGTSLLYDEDLEMFENKLNELGFPVKYKKEIVCIPSYLEKCVIYAIWKD